MRLGSAFARFRQKLTVFGADDRQSFSRTKMNKKKRSERAPVSLDLLTAQVNSPNNKNALDDYAVFGLKNILAHQHFISPGIG